MTRRERLEAVINGDITEELIESCKEELKKLNERGAKANQKAKESKNYLENKEYEKVVLNVVGAEPMQIGEIAKATGIEVTRQRLTAICTNLVREGKLESVDVKVKGKGTRKGYVRIC